MARKILFLSKVILVTACTFNSQAPEQTNAIEKTEKKIDDKSIYLEDSTTNQDDETLEVSDADERFSFEKFYQQFSSDSAFQINNIDFPVEYLTYDPSGDSIITEYLDRSEWQFVDLTYDSSSLTRRYDKYRQEISVWTDSAVVGFKGVDNGIFVEYNYKRYNQTWSLISWSDFSF